MNIKNEYLIMIEEMLKQSYDGYITDCSIDGRTGTIKMSYIYRPVRSVDHITLNFEIGKKVKDYFEGYNDLFKVE